MPGFKLNHVSKWSHSELNLEIIGDYNSTVKPNATMYSVMDNLVEM